MLEDNKYALSVHTRNVSAADLPRLDELVQGVLEEQPLLRRSEGKHVIELKPQVRYLVITPMASTSSSSSLRSARHVHVHVACGMWHDVHVA